MSNIIWGAPPQLNLGVWEKASCPKIGKNEVFTNEGLPLDLLRIHACNQGP